MRFVRFRPGTMLRLQRFPHAAVCLNVADGLTSTSSGGAVTPSESCIECPLPRMLHRALSSTVFQNAGNTGRACPFQFRPPQLVFSARPAGAGIVAALCLLCGIRAARQVRRCRLAEFWARLRQDGGHTIRDQVGGLTVDFINLVLRELALPKVDILQRHQEDHAGPGFFICAIEKRLPCVGSQPHGAGETVHPRLPQDLVTIRVDFINRLTPQRSGHGPGHGIVMLHDGPDGFLGGLLAWKLRIASFAPDMGESFGRWDHLGAGEKACDVPVKLAQRHGHGLEGQGVQQGVQTIQPLVFLIYHGPSFQRARGADARDYGAW